MKHQIRFLKLGLNALSLLSMIFILSACKNMEATKSNSGQNGTSDFSLTEIDPSNPSNPNTQTPKTNLPQPTQRDCTVIGGTGTQTFADGTFGPCIANACSENYSLSEGRCMETTQVCQIENGAGQRILIDNQYGDCHAVACNTGFTLFQGGCFASSTACVGSSGGATGIQLFDSSLSTYTSCQITSCGSGFSLSISQNVCVPTSKTCPISNGTGRQTFSNDSYGPCTAISCNSGFQLSNGTCSATINNVINAATTPFANMSLTGSPGSLSVTTAAAGQSFAPISTVRMNGRERITFDFANNSSVAMAFDGILFTGNAYIQAIAPTDGQCNISLTGEPTEVFPIVVNPGQHIFITLSNLNPALSAGPCQLTFGSPTNKILELTVVGDMH